MEAMDWGGVPISRQVRSEETKWRVKFVATKATPQVINIRNRFSVNATDKISYRMETREVISIEYIIEYFFCRLLRGALGSNATPPGSKKR